MLYPPKLYFKNKYNLFLLSTALVLNLFIWFWLFSEIRPQYDMIFLHYNILFGVDFFGPWWQIVYVPLSGLFILLVNTVVAWLLFYNYRFFSFLLNFISVFCQIFLLIFSSILIFLNV